MAKKWDVFICHASEDKSTLVAELARLLAAASVRVWYDEFSLRPGDSLRRKLDEGIRDSRYGLVVLSPAFFGKNWPEHELDGLVAGDVAGFGGIIPIWHGVGRSEVYGYSPTLADKVGIRTDGKTVRELAIEVIRVVRPDAFNNIVARAAIAKAGFGPPVLVDLSALRPGPVRHVSLGKELVGRIRGIRAALADVYPMSLEAWIGGFQRDLDPDDEIARWEHIAAIYLETYERLATPEERRATFGYLLMLSLGLADQPGNDLEADLARVWAQETPDRDSSDEFRASLGEE